MFTHIETNIQKGFRVWKNALSVYKPLEYEDTCFKQIPHEIY